MYLGKIEPIVWKYFWRFGKNDCSHFKEGPKNFRKNAHKHICNYFITILLCLELNLKPALIKFFVTPQVLSVNSSIFTTFLLVCNNNQSHWTERNFSNCRLPFMRVEHKDIPWTIAIAICYTFEQQLQVSMLLDESAEVINNLISAYTSLSIDAVQQNLPQMLAALIVHCKRRIT